MLVQINDDLVFVLIVKTSMYTIDKQIITLRRLGGQQFTH